MRSTWLCFFTSGAWFSNQYFWNCSRERCGRRFRQKLSLIMARWLLTLPHRGENNEPCLEDLLARHAVQHAPAAVGRLCRGKPAAQGARRARASRRVVDVTE